MRTKYLVLVEVKTPLIIEAEGTEDLMKKLASEYLIESSQELYIRCLKSIIAVQDAVDLYNKFAEEVFGTVTAIYEISSTIYPSDEAIYGR